MPKSTSETGVQAIEEQNMKGGILKFGYKRFTDMTNRESKALPIRGLIPEEQTELPILGEQVRLVLGIWHHWSH